MGYAGISINPYGVITVCIPGGMPYGAIIIPGWWVGIPVGIGIGIYWYMGNYWG